MSNDASPARQPAAAGSTQRTRALPALDPAGVPIDERGVPYRLAFAGEYARLLAFHELTGDATRDWTPFFQQDATFLLAEMCAVRFKEEHFKAVALERKLRSAAEDPALQREVVGQIYDLAARIDNWYRRACYSVQAVHPDLSLEKTLKSVIQGDLIKYQLALTSDAVLRAYWDDCPQRPRPEGGPQQFAEVWSKPKEGSEEEPPSALPDEPRSERLITVLNAFHRASKKLGEVALAQLEDSLQPLEAPLAQLEPGTRAANRSRSDHRPHAGLYMSFALLMERVRADLNKFAEHHLEYYYRTMLKLRERDGVADTAHLCFELAPHARELALDAGTRLRGKDAGGREVLFATREDVALNAARVAALMTLNITRAATSGASPGPVNRIVAHPMASSEDGRHKPLQHPDLGWSTFGAELPGGKVELPASKPAVGGALDTEVGVMIASPLLLLTAGQREIAITFGLQEPDSGASVAEVLGNYRDAVNRSVAATGTPPASQAPGELPGDSCLLYVSGEKGWVPIPSFKLHYDSDAATIELRFGFQASDPPIVRPADAGLVGGVDSAWPMVKIVLNPGALVHPYSFFQQLTLDALSIKVKATGLRDLQLHGSMGPIKSGQPFPVFGAVPVQGASLHIAHPELSTKPLEYVALSIDWIGVPKSFATYYQAYGHQIGDTTFQGKLFVHSGGKWLEEQFALFAERSRVSATLDLSRSGHAVDAAAGVEARCASLRDKVPAGVLRLELAEPDVAFGHELYPQAVAAAALARTSAALREVMRPARPVSGAKSKAEDGPPEKQSDYVKVSLDLADWVSGGAREQGEAGTGAAGSAAPAGSDDEGKVDANGTSPFPNPPFVPWVRDMSIDYVASACIRLDGQAGEVATGKESIELFDLYPFGHRKRRAGERPLFPVFDAEGYLYIGLADLAPPQAITLLFQLRETAAFQQLVDSRKNIGDALGGLRWGYLARDHWRALPAEAVIADSTECLTRSGIVKLRIPDDATHKNAVMPSNLVWIQVSAVQHTQSYPNIVGIYPHAVTARRITPMPDDAAGGSLPPATVTELVEKLAAVKAVQQPMATVGGRPREPAGQFRTRVSERLRHKQRAIQPFDYERLVLDAFPEIGEARCFTRNATQAYGDNPVKLGTVVVAVAPAGDARVMSSAPRVPYSTLAEVAKFLKGLASPSVRDITVVNPLYEHVELTAEVRFVAEKETRALRRLKDDVADYLAPWRSRPDQPMRLGVGPGSVRALGHFMEDLDYVERVRLESVAVVRDARSRKSFAAPHDEVRGSMPWSVLVPADDIFGGPPGSGGTRISAGA